MYLNDDSCYNLTEGSQLPYPNRPTGLAPSALGGYNLAVGEQLPYPNYDPGDIFAPMNPIFTLSGAEPQFTVTSPIIPASMLTATYTPGETYAPPMYSYSLGSAPAYQPPMFPTTLGLSPSAPAAYFATSNVTVPGGMMEGRGDVRDVLEPILLADLLLGL